MGAPAVAVSALAKTRTGRKVVAALGLVIVLMVAAAVTSLIAIPLAIVGQSATSAVSDDPSPGLPEVKGEWGYPLAGPYSSFRGFGYFPVKGCAFCPADHLGYDMDQPCGVTVFAAGPGKVINAGPMPGWGNTVRIDHGDGLVTLYGHMAWDSLRVEVGEHVLAGTPLGAEGSTGKSTGCHLHYEVQLDGAPIDPKPFMAARGLPLI